MSLIGFMGSTYKQSLTTLYMIFSSVWLGLSHAGFSQRYLGAAEEVSPGNRPNEALLPTSRGWGVRRFVASRLSKAKPVTNNFTRAQVHVRNYRIHLRAGCPGFGSFKKVLYGEAGIRRRFLCRWMGLFEPWRLQTASGRLSRCAPNVHESGSLMVRLSSRPRRFRTLRRNGQKWGGGLAPHRGQAVGNARICGRHSRWS